MANIKCLRIIFCVSVITVAIVYARSKWKSSNALKVTDVTMAKSKLSESTTLPSKRWAVENKDSNKKPTTDSKKQAVPSSKGCAAKFGKTLGENIEKIKSYNLSKAEPYFRDLDSQAAPPEVILKGPGKSNIEIPVVVTGASSDHYKESLMMLKNLNKVVRPTYKTIRVYYYDLGLEPEQRAEVTKRCNCTVVTFPFEKFPPHVRQLKAYCWKPLIIKMMTKISQFVMWMDASIRFTTSDLDPLFQQGKQQGVLMYHNVWLLPAHVHQDTFTFLEETPCLYNNFTEYHAGLILIHSGKSIVKQYIIDPWVKCALIEDCMKTRHEPKSILGCRSHNTYHSCHRFDQAVLSLMILRLFHKTFKDYDIDHKYFRICYDETC